MTSSLRNSIHRRNHKERSQLAHRAKLGLLEKHADYVKRARDYHSKQDRLTRLKQKAADRNKDEFYFSMTKEKTKGGVHSKDRGNVALPTDMIKVLKTQDENYVRTMRASNMKKIDKIKSQLSTVIDLTKDSLPDEDLDVLKEAGLIPKAKGKQRQKRNIVFVEDGEKYTPSAESSKKTTGAKTSEVTQNSDATTDLGWIAPSGGKRKRKAREVTSDGHEDGFGAEEDVEEEGFLDELEDLSSTPSTHPHARLIKELSARLQRDTQLRYAQREFELQRLMMGKGARKKIRAAEPADGADDDEDDEDALDARGGRSSKKSGKRVDESTYKPRVYKWRLERKR
ncbi:hypothetical protein V5O48_003483 [Marasmius crinis-equi]|uniref:U3 small nucleolar RNA-associated protein 11 n=1 Tax=Marasmius crinis-equi TaxID=585013 RepID=A0ABR3FSN3_9AGAR